MKKYLALSLVCFFLLSFLVPHGFSQDAKKILNSMIKALGGRKAMQAIKDTTISGPMEMPQMGLSGTITMYHKEPNMLRQDIEIDLMDMLITQSFDGETAWWTNPNTGAAEELPAEAQEDAENEALGFGFGWILTPDKFGITFADKGKETIEGKEYLVLEFTFEGGDVSVYYLDPRTYLPYKVTTTTTNQMGFEVEQETVMQDYKKVDGVMYSHMVTIYQDGEEFASVVVEEVKFNTGLEDSFFKM